MIIVPGKPQDIYIFIFNYTKQEVIQSKRDLCKRQWKRKMDHFYEKEKQAIKVDSNSLKTAPSGRGFEKS